MNINMFNIIMYGMYAPNVAGKRRDAAVSEAEARNGSALRKHDVYSRRRRRFDGVDERVESVCIYALYDF